MKRIAIIGGGFAGTWSAIAATKRIKDLNKANEVEVVLINPDDFMGIRPRYYEKDISQAKVPFNNLLKPIGVHFLNGKVTNILWEKRKVRIENRNELLDYDKLIITAGSRISIPPISGLKEHSFNVDTYHEAVRLQSHLDSLSRFQNSDGVYTVIVIGAGFTGIEIATEIVSKLEELTDTKKNKPRVILLDRGSKVGNDMGAESQFIVEQALNELNIEVILQRDIHQVDQDGVILSNGEKCASKTVIWAGGLRANPLTKLLPVTTDPLGRLFVDRALKVRGMEHIFAAGDVARAQVDEQHVSLMSCQHAIPQGKIVGTNVVNEMFEKQLLHYEQPNYVTCLDLGSWGALFTKGWDRNVFSYGADTKKMKESITQSKIYPPLSGDPEDILNAVGDL
jgi:NADH:ubiquinone reductase (H+-translocating)